MEGGREGNKRETYCRKKETNRELRSDVSSDRREETILEEGLRTAEVEDINKDLYNRGSREWIRESEG